MSFEPVFDEIIAEQLSVAAHAQAVVEARLTPPEGVSVAKVLSVACVSGVSAAEVFAGEARYNGYVEFSVLYLSGEGAINVMETRAEFTDRIAGDKITSTLTPFFLSDVLDVDTKSCGDAEICPACVVEITMLADCGQKTRCLIDCGEGVYTKKESINCLKTLDKGVTKVSLPVECNNTGIEKLLKNSASVIIKKVSARQDAVVAEGETVVRLIGLSAAGTLCEKVCRRDFCEEIEAEGVSGDDVALVSAAVADVSARGISEDGAITYEIDIAAEFYKTIFQKQQKEVVCDTFSMKKETVMDSASDEVCSDASYYTFSDTISGNITLDIGNAPVDGILCFDGAKATVTGSYVQNELITVEGIVSGNVVYYSEEEKETCAVSVEIPFSVTESALTADGIPVLARAEVCEHFVRARRANEISVKAEVCFCITVAQKSRCKFITALSEGAEKQRVRSAITLHVGAKGEGLWEIAKSTGFSPEQIMEQNPELTLPLKGNERILVYGSADKD